MKISINQNYHCRFKWLKKPIVSLDYKDWLVSKCSLTKRLKLRYADFEVQTVELAFKKPLQHEVPLLKLRAQQAALIRDVKLMGDGQAVVFAHSVLPRKSLRGAWHGLSRLGNRPLGAELFGNAKVRRKPLTYKKLTRQHALYQLVVSHLQPQPNYLWARRSIFQLNCAKILVTEVFLPNILRDES